MYHFISFTLFYALNTPFRLKKQLIVHFSIVAIRMVFADWALWHHQCLSVTSCECDVVVLWRYIRRLVLHVQIDANAIFTIEERPSISISHHLLSTAKRVRIFILQFGWSNSRGFCFSHEWWWLVSGNKCVWFLVAFQLDSRVHCNELPVSAYWNSHIHWCIYEALMVIAYDWCSGRFFMTT